MHIKLKKKRGQSTVEYVLLMTAVVAVIIALVTSPKGGLQTQLNSTFNSAIGTVGDMTERLGGVVGTGVAGNSYTPPPYSVNVAP